MENILIIDNFSKLDTIRVNEPLVLGIHQDYKLAQDFTSQSYPNVSAYASATALRIRGQGTANWCLTRRLLEEPSRYVLGLRYLDFNSSPGSAQLAIVANVTDSSYDVVLALEFSATSLTVHYRDADGAKTETTPITLTADTYVDVTVNKVSNTLNEMSECVVNIDNFPAYVGNVFNNVGSALSWAFTGVIPTAPTPDVEGYLTHVDSSVTAPASSNYYITDMYMTRNGKRYGNPIVHSSNITSFTSQMLPVGADTTLEIVNSVASDWVFAQGTGEATGAFEETSSLEVAQVTAYMQSNQDQVPVTLTAGGQTQAQQLPEQVTQLRVFANAPTPNVVLEIGDE